ncbi:zinc finger protein ZAT4-like [Carya illinoinensis]|uniref:zinc finger protein ZAT4-like n=1 Tax=Carya illinoinensis TaxID=32201 RepID=UPI001C722FBE|nr:zinc finger protein ZAT4-like [Carya illinoinensis]
MRSHLAKLPIPSKPIQQHDNSVVAKSTQPSWSPSSSSSLNFHSIKNPTQSYPSLKRRFSLIANSGSKSDAESQPAKKSTRRRSKRCRKTVVPLAKSPLEPEQLSFVSNTFFEEEGALCLIMLSRDKWSTKGQEKVQEVVEGSLDDHEDEDHKGTDNYPSYLHVTASGKVQLRDEDEDEARG